jgi:excisionase family DNA binding protein
MEDEKFYTIKEVAELLKVSDGGVRKWLKTGKLKGIKLGRIWRIRESDFDKFLKERESAGEKEKRI